MLQELKLLGVTEIIEYIRNNNRSSIRNIEKEGKTATPIEGTDLLEVHHDLSKSR